MPRSTKPARGLSALIPKDVDEVLGQRGDTPYYTELPIEQISTNPYQPRRSFDEEALDELAASIKHNGLIQSIVVRPTESGYELVAGERRLRASKRAGMSTISAIVRTGDDLSSLEQALVENVQRQNLNSIDEAIAYQQLIDDFNLTHDAVASRVGKSRASITNTIRLLSLPPGVQQWIESGQLTAGHARALLGTHARRRQEALAKQAVKEKWSVRAVEEAVRGETGSGGSPDPNPIDGAGLAPLTRLRPPGLLELEKLLADRLETRVAINLTAKRGRVTIDFADLPDLERIYRAMIGGS